MGPEEIQSHPAFSQPWYYQLELAPGLYTPGEERPSVGLTRELLARAGVGPGVRCLDIGAQEALVSILMERRGADVVAYDRVFSRERLELVKEALGVEFELVGEPIEGHTEEVWIGRGGPQPGVGLPLYKLPEALSQRGHGPFDVVVFSGVLYHVYDPLGALAVVRGLVRTGGIVIVETAAMFDAAMALRLNARGRFTPLAIWMVSPALLDYLLRLVRLKPIDVSYFGQRRGRIAIACRAVDAPPAAGMDPWIHSPIHDYELAEYLDWEALASDDPPVTYKGEPEQAHGLDVLEAVRAAEGLRPGPARSRLDLAAET